MQTIENSLLPEEKILWSGAPGSGLLFTRWDIVLIPITLLFVVVAVSRALDVWRIDRVEVLFKGLFLCLALFLFVGRFFLDMLARRSMRYALTDKRLLIERRHPLPKFRAYDYRKAPTARLSETADGRGTIRLYDALSIFTQFNSSAAWMPALDRRPQLLDIAEAHAVFELIRKQRGG